MTTPGSTHPLDIDLADLVDGILDEPRALQLEAHLTGCIVCRIKRLRLSQAPPAGPARGGEPFPFPGFEVPRLDEGAVPATGELWLAGDEERVLVLVLGPHGVETVLVAPVTFDVEAADDQTVVVDAARSPLGTGIVVHPVQATALPRTVLAGRLATLATAAELPALLAGDAPGTRRGPAIDTDADPRLELRGHIADRLGDVEHDRVRSTLIDDLQALRGAACAVRALDTWPDLPDADRRGWVPLAMVDEVGVVLVVLDTPHGLVDDRDFDVARAVLTRCNASALVVLTRELSDSADVFDAASLNHGIDMPSGAHTPPRPLIAGLVAFDAVTKYLDQHSGARAMSLPTRGPLARVDVGDILRDAAAGAVADSVRKGARFKVVPKRRGYESLAGAPDALGEALGQAFTGGSVAEALLDLARRSDEDETP
ncbi:MAG: hypothetical protein AVDCRST_MAG10-113 [uncultured Acidimicrobiales bacterium]|uniref:Zinc-finger domain-containing protein n=1 Tax=uncultured Acidimicrobiales bacterium TaxID=310071 RepID=A0A6J4H0M0_9ACTN|nr:MAG: hypothetical protein AVDCRST_MAG10-113 [uncultured Acidimicrobiales bacterium]